MWLMTDMGMYSIVRHNDEPDTFLLRARNREHLEKLKDRCPELSGIQIVNTPDADYPARMFVPKGEVALVFARMLLNVDYGNFKNHVLDIGGDKSYLDFLHTVWASSKRLEVTVPATVPMEGMRAPSSVFSLYPEKGKSKLMDDVDIARRRLVSVARNLAGEKRAEIERLKEGANGLARPDFLWHYLLQSFATMGRAAGQHGLIGKKDNYNRVTYAVLSSLTPDERYAQVHATCRAAGIRMPRKKAQYILGCFRHITELGGPEAAKARLLSMPGRKEKIAFLQTFPGIGPKYARNIMMDVYEKDFRDSIAIDIRIKAISESLGLSFKSYIEHEAFYLKVAREAGLNGWELDRLLFSFHKLVQERLGDAS